MLTKIARRELRVQRVFPRREDPLMTLLDERPLAAPPRFIWLDITRRCQQTCNSHCYNASGPDGTHGTMAASDWIRVLREAQACGVERVTFIGGEPTLNPALPSLIREARSLGLRTGVFTNLVRVTEELWDLFQGSGVTLGTSYYSPDPTVHARVTGRPTLPRIRANIAKAIALGVTVRATIVTVGRGQDVDGAVADLRALGVTTVSFEHVRPFGRGRGEHEPCDVGELCGHCGRGRAAVGPDGSVTPCVMTDWLSVGCVHTQQLGAILASGAMADAVSGIPVPHGGACPPGDSDDCGKTSPACSPAYGSPPPVPPQPRDVPQGPGAL